MSDAWRHDDHSIVGAAGENVISGATLNGVVGFAAVDDVVTLIAENRIAGFNADQLFDPKTNLEAGTWYLHRATQRWSHQSDPTPFALAEYNAGASRAQRWSGGNSLTEIPERQFLQKIDFPTTRRYVESIIDRYKFYQRRGRM